MNLTHSKDRSHLDASVVYAAHVIRYYTQVVSHNHRRNLNDYYEQLL